MKKKLLSLVLVTALMMPSGNFAQVSAKEINTTNGDHTFEKAWEETVYFNNGSSKLVYGFNTLFINEDYTHSKKQYSQAYVVNDNGTHRGNAALRSKWSKIEVRHKGSLIFYGAIY